MPLLIISLSNLIVERNFVIWMLEPDLKVLKIQETKENSIGTQKELSLMKVMYNENTELQVDQELNVPEKVIQAGMGYLIENSVMIPKSQRKDSNFYISYINLNSVTSSETLLEKCANLHICKCIPSHICNFSFTYLYLLLRIFVFREAG